MEEISSQNSDLGLEDLDKLEAKGQAENTKRATSWRIKKFEKWCDKRKLKVDFNCVTPVELNELLRKFYAEVKSEKGQPLTPSTLTGIRAAIHRQLTSAPISRSMNIMQDSSKCKLYTKEMNPKPTHKSLIAAGDMLKLRGYFSEGHLALFIEGSRGGAVVRALASHQCGPGSIPGLGVICGLSLLLVLVLAPRVFLRVLRFSSLLKN